MTTLAHTTFAIFRNAGKVLLQLRVLRLGFFQDGDVGVGVFPESEEIVVGCAGFRYITLHGVGTTRFEGGCANNVVVGPP